MHMARAETGYSSRWKFRPKPKLRYNTAAKEKINSKE
jgi:hypothetical protein